MWFISVSRFGLLYRLECCCSYLYGFTLVTSGVLYSLLFGVSLKFRLCVEDRNVGLLLQIVTWMEICLILSTHIKSSLYIY